MYRHDANRGCWMKEGQHHLSVEITRGLQCRIPEADVDANYSPIDPFDVLECCTIYECFHAFKKFFTKWYRNACIVICAVISDVKTLWIITNGSYVHKGKIVGKLLVYYLIVFTVYIIDNGFWINKNIIRLIWNALLETKINTRVLLCLGAMVSFILTVLLLHRTFMFSTCKD